jgi:acetyltransferase-like isoleucine patch superfamily enzyme
VSGADDLLARVRGEWIRWKLYVRSLGRVQIGSGFRAYGPVEVIGQGRIQIGNDVTVARDPFGVRAVSLQTQGSRDARIEIGDGVSLLGTHISCGQRVTVERKAWIEDARIMDSDFHETGASSERKNLSVASAVEVRVGEGAMIAGRAMVLKGARVGAGSTVRPGSVVLREAPDFLTVLGYPARVERVNVLGPPLAPGAAGTSKEPDASDGRPANPSKSRQP